jgi:hypothetical protein
MDEDQEIDEGGLVVIEEPLEVCDDLDERPDEWKPTAPADD